MANNDIGGVWRTIGGRRVFIKDGQDLASAMRESGKFKTTKKNENKKDHTFNMSEEDKKKYEKVGKKIDDLTKEIEQQKNQKENQYGYSKEEWDKFQKMPMTDYERENFHNEEDLKKYQEIKKDTLEYYTEDFGWEGKTPEEAFIEQMEAVKDYKTTTPYEMGKRLAEGGDYLVANDDMEKFLEERGINPTRKGDVFSTYTDYMGQVQAEMYKEFKSEKGKANKLGSEKDNNEIRQNKPIEPVEDRLKNNMIVSHYGNHVAYRDKDNNLIVTGRENYNDYVNGKKDRLGGEFVTNDNDALKTMIGYEGLDKYPYEGATRDEKTGNGKNWKDFVDSEYNRLKDRVIDTTNAREERAKTNENYRENSIKELAEKRYGSSEEDFDKIIKERLGVDKSQKDYDNLKDQVSKVYKEEMSKKNELLNNQEFKKLVKDTYGDMQQVREMGLSVDQVKKQILSDVNDEIDYWKHQDKDYWKDVNANPKQQVKAYENLKKFISNYGEKTTNQAMNDSIRNAYNDYKKKHPNTKLSFTNFKDTYK